MGFFTSIIDRTANPSISVRPALRSTFEAQGQDHSDADMERTNRKGEVGMESPNRSFLPPAARQERPSVLDSFDNSDQLEGESITSERQIRHSESEQTIRIVGNNVLEQAAPVEPRDVETPSKQYQTKLPSVLMHQQLQNADLRSIAEKSPIAASRLLSEDHTMADREREDIEEKTRSRILGLLSGLHPKDDQRLIVEPQGRRNHSSTDQRLSSGEDVSHTVHVTIGRVEVRATQENRPGPKKSRVRSPDLTLDQYLKQRRNGDRS